MTYSNLDNLINRVVVCKTHENRTYSNYGPECDIPATTNLHYYIVVGVVDQFLICMPYKESIQFHPSGFYFNKVIKISVNDLEGVTGVVANLDDYGSPELDFRR